MQLAVVVAAPVVVVGPGTLRVAGPPAVACMQLVAGVGARGVPEVGKPLVVVAETPAVGAAGKALVGETEKPVDLTEQSKALDMDTVAAPGECSAAEVNYDFGSQLMAAEAAVEGQQVDSRIHFEH